MEKFAFVNISKILVESIQHLVENTLHTQHGRYQNHRMPSNLSPKWAYQMPMRKIRISFLRRLYDNL